jgi:glyoxylase-like metal-dependent hydrolase (beta-lactamase superfamily II)
MRLYTHYCPIGFSNSYVLGTDYKGKPEKEEREAIIIDLGAMDKSILGYIENNRYKLRAVFLTHDHEAHSAGVRVLKRIYDVDIYAASEFVFEYKTNKIKDGDFVNIGSSFKIEVLSIPGHSMDSVVYKIENLLFTGDVLSAGLLGGADSSFGAMQQISTIQNKLFSLPGNHIVMPGHGPPSTLDVERAYNIGVKLFQEEMSKSKRPNFKMEFLE